MHLWFSPHMGNFCRGLHSGLKAGIKTGLAAYLAELLHLRSLIPIGQFLGPVTKSYVVIFQSSPWS